MKTVLTLSGVALALNVVSVLLRLDYLMSTLLVLGVMAASGLTLLGEGQGKGLVSASDIKLFVGFVVFSNIMTFGLEAWMLHYDVWGFSSRTYHLQGTTFFGYPVEEYVYWFLCPVLVASHYISMSRTLGRCVFVLPKWLGRLDSYVSALKTTQVVIQTRPDKGNTPYVDGIEDQNRYSRGNKFPVYALVQVLIIAAILAMYRTYRGNRTALFGTAAVFTATAFPHELYTVHNGFWVYNAQRMLGPQLFSIPLEGYFMYVIAPVCGGMMLDTASRFVFGKDV